MDLLFIIFGLYFTMRVLVYLERFDLFRDVHHTYFNLFLDFILYAGYIFMADILVYLFV